MGATTLNCAGLMSIARYAPAPSPSGTAASISAIRWAVLGPSLHVPDPDPRLWMRAQRSFKESEVRGIEPANQRIDQSANHSAYRKLGEKVGVGGCASSNQRLLKTCSLAKPTFPRASVLAHRRTTQHRWFHEFDGPLSLSLLPPRH
jgi:hypothetical protein